MADDDLDFDIDDRDDPAGRRSPGDGSGGRRRGPWWGWLLLGAALGVAATLLVPRWVTPHLPPALGGGLQTVEAEVLDKQRDSARLLLTLDSERGAMLATFEDRVPELDLLIGPGDSVTLAMAEIRPFVDGPRVVGVRKGEWEGRVPTTLPDTGEAPPDTGEAPPDTGEAPPDTGEAPPDTGETPPDTGEAPPDTVPAGDRVGSDSPDVTDRTRRRAQTSTSPRISSTRAYARSPRTPSGPARS